MLIAGRRLSRVHDHLMLASAPSPPRPSPPRGPPQRSQQLAETAAAAAPAGLTVAQVEEFCSR
eukprot:COSAG01_NODE_41962_length_445_cov_0.742775_1_plen_62_part_10